MKLLYRWIREFVDLDLGAAEAADRLVHAGIEVPGVTPRAPELRGVVVAEIEAIERELGESHGHRLLLCSVSTGSRRFPVVCGAPNTAIGLRTAFAPPGATLPGGRGIESVKIRGAESQGMLCSERELGLGDEHEAGVLALDDAAPLGADLVDHLGLDDHVIEIEVTPNRPDCLSIVGMARELAALTGARFRPPVIDLRETDEPVESLARVRIEAPELCWRFTARVISDVKVGPSPLWLALRLRAVGLRPISNVVDATNYVMWELGHPLHAFDSAAVTDGTIVVRRAHLDEAFVTLDGQTRKLDPEMCVVADPRRAIGLAGVMGGANTEVTDATSRVLLEAAWFHPGATRRTARTLGLRTDAAYRFERRADIDALAPANARTAQLMAELAGGRVARGVIDVYPTRREPVRIHLRSSRVKRVIGVVPPPAQTHDILERLGLDVHDVAHGPATTAAPGRPAGDPSFDVDVPSFRRDLVMEDDLVEEIIRVWGYDRIPSTIPGGAITLVRQPETHRQARTVRQALVGAGLLEAVTPSFSDPERAAVLRAPDTREPIALVNPMSQEASLLRQHPLEGVLGAVALNLRRQQSRVRLFEVVTTYARTSEGPLVVDENIREPRWVAIAITGPRADDTWHGSRDLVDVYDAKGLAELVLQAFRVESHTGAGRLPGFEADARAALVAGDGAIVAEFGEVASEVRERFGIDVPVFAAAVSLDAIGEIGVAPLAYRPLPRFPAVQRDLAFLVDDPRVAAADITVAIREAAGPLLRAVVLFDVYRFDDGRRSLAWRLTFQADDRTLTDDEVNRIQDGIARAVAARFAVTLRSQ